MQRPKQDVFKSTDAVDTKKTCRHAGFMPPSLSFEVSAAVTLNFSLFFTQTGGIASGEQPNNGGMVNEQRRCWVEVNKVRAPKPSNQTRDMT